MQDIKELAHILNANYPNQLSDTKLNFEKGSKLSLFFQGLCNEKINSDEDALMYLYQSKVENSTYRKLKATLRECLIDVITNLNATAVHFSDYQKAYFECHKQWVAVKILTGQNANIAAMSLAAKLFKRTAKYDFVHLSMDIAAYLRLQYALRESTDKKFQEANQLFAYYRDVHDAECLAEELYALSMVNFSSKSLSKDRAVENLGHYTAQILPLLQKFDSYRVQLYGRLIGLWNHNVIGNFEAALMDSEDAIRFFKTKPYEARGALQIFYYEKLTSHIQLQQFEDGRKVADQIQQYLKAGTFNWFKVQELFVILSMHTKEYSLAAEAIFKVLHHTGFQFLPENNKEVWKVYEAYVYLLICAQEVPKPTKFAFKLSKFANETPLLSKEKSGMNVAIKVVRLLILIAERKYAQVFEETESLEQYCYRYLKEEQTQRSFLFLKMLLQIPAGQFDRLEVEKRVRKYVDRLIEIPVKVGGKSYETEIIPYENLWGIAISLI